MTTLHILSSADSPVNINNRIDPFSIAAIKFIRYMSQYGWNCIHYGIDGTEVPCEMVQCLDYIVEDRSINIQRFNEKAGQEIARRKQPGDMIVCFFGHENKGACVANPDLMAVEPSIGYDTKAVFAPYRAFVSYAQMHMFYGERGMLMNPSWFDAVIQNAITPSEFEFQNCKEDYFLYFGRVIEAKGIHLAIQATAQLGKKLIVAGPGRLQDIGYNTIPDHVEAVGLCDAIQRKELMKNAKAIMGLTYYVEPFGNMIAEGYMCGTPAITTDWGGFSETVIPGITGFRCREFRDVLQAIENIDSIDPKDCKKHAMKNYADEVVHPLFDQYFNKLKNYDFYRE
jgi:glycosyltransferase involved in cell wall biosynthesis